MELDLADIRQTFFQDAEEHLEEIDSALAQLTPEEDWSETVGSLFRSVHSLKGDSGALGFSSIETLLHRFETHLDLLREGEASLTSYSVDIFSLVASCLEELLSAAKEDRPAPQGVEAVLSLLDELDREQPGETSEPKQDEAPEGGAEDFGLFGDEATTTGAVSEQPAPSFGDYLVQQKALSRADLTAAQDHQRACQPLLGTLLLNSGAISVKDAEAILQEQEKSSQRFGEIAVQMGLLREESLSEALAEQVGKRPSLTATLVDLGLIDAGAVDRLLQEFLAEYPDADVAQAPAEPVEEEGVSEAAGTSGQDQAFDCDPQLLADFVSDSDEHLSGAEENLLVIEGDPQNSDAINAIYRAFHTMKGLSSFLGLEDTRNLAHQAESMLNLARDGKLLLTGDAFEVALASVDGLKRQVQYAEQWLSNTGPLRTDNRLPKLLSAIEAVSNGTTPCDLGAAPDEAESPKRGQPEAGPANTPASRSDSTTQIKETIKVDRDRLDKLINVIGELVIGHAMVEQEAAQWCSEAGVESFALSQLDKTVRDLQELSLSLRMVPVGGVFHKMARIVRDLGRKLGKNIKFSTSGDETELDKTVVDQIGDPLLHMVRNAADHGIETPEERVAAGKPEQGSVTLRAYHQGGNIYLEIADDGKGLDPDVLLKKAIDKGIVGEDETLTESEIYNLIFAPGFSTAKEVTDVSGRGVGMDVVRRNVEALQGSVSITSRKGEGSTVVIRLPLTLAILDGLSIRLGQQVFIVPILSVVESFRPSAGEIRRVGGEGEVVMVRGEVVPLIRLDQILNVTRARPAEAEAQLVVIVEDRGKKYALLVDELVNQSQVVIKNLETNYQKVDGLAGATILGNGRIAMILDIFGLVCLASKNKRVSPPGSDREPVSHSEPLPKTPSAHEVQEA